MACDHTPSITSHTITTPCMPCGHSHSIIILHLLRMDGHGQHHHPRIASRLSPLALSITATSASSLGFSPPTSTLNACMVGGGSILGLHCPAERSPSASYTVRLASNSTGTLLNHSSPSLPSAARTFLPNILLPPPQLTPPLPNHGSCIGCALLQIRQVPSRAPIHRNF